MKDFNIYPLWLKIALTFRIGRFNCQQFVLLKKPFKLTYTLTYICILNLCSL